MDPGLRPVNASHIPNAVSTTRRGASHLVPENGFGDLLPAGITLAVLSRTKFSEPVRAKPPHRREQRLKWYR